ncbi:hypothetical protein MED222_05055 [Vibrio sp. MED222]|nr:hypothetical protein MED222_05055 [Vibrio sp. MED222]
MITVHTIFFWRTSATETYRSIIDSAFFATHFRDIDTAR